MVVASTSTSAAMFAAAAFVNEGNEHNARVDATIDERKNFIFCFVLFLLLCCFVFYVLILLLILCQNEFYERKVKVYEMKNK